MLSLSLHGVNIYMYMSKSSQRYMYIKRLTSVDVYDDFFLYKWP